MAAVKRSWAASLLTVCLLVSDGVGVIGSSVVTQYTSLEFFGKGPGNPFLHKKGFPGILPQKDFKMTDLTHFDEKGQAHMVNVGEKDVTTREAVARGEVRMQPETLSLILDDRAREGRRPGSGSYCGDNGREEDSGADTAGASPALEFRFSGFFPASGPIGNRN